MEKRKLELSIVLPAYKERENLAILIPELEKNFRELAFFEIVIIDDNSQDGTDELIEKLNREFENIRLITRPGLNGIGSALRDGYNAAEGAYILSVDADLSFTVPDIVRLYKKAREGYDIVVGYRYGPEAYYEKRGVVVKIKYLISRFGNFVIKKLSGIKLRDFSTNFRIIRREKWAEIKANDSGNVFLFETILRATRKGLKIGEIPVSLYERRLGQSKLSIWKEAPRFLIKFLKYTFLE